MLTGINHTFLLIKYLIFLLFLNTLAGLNAYAHLSDRQHKLTIAVASNFQPAMEKLIVVFEAQCDCQIVTVYGASGKLTAQIMHGAPFDVFLSADQAKIAFLQQKNRLIPNSTVTYAQGLLGVWSKLDAVNNLTELKQQLNTANKIAIANPKLAPYGQAAYYFLNQHTLDYANKIVMGENVAHAFQYIQTNNVKIALVAWSQLIGSNVTQRFKLDNHIWQIPNHLYPDIKQDGAIIKHSKQQYLAKEFMQFLTSDAALSIIESSGYIRHL